MKRNCHTEQQITGVLKAHEADVTIANIFSTELPNRDRRANYLTPPMS